MPEKKNTMVEAVRPIDKEKIEAMLNQKKGKMKLSLFICAHCGLCAESCFLYRSHNKDPKYMPSYKAVNSLGKLYKRGKKVDRFLLEEIREIIWRNCVLCGRCYCPLGIDIPSIIALARSICRSQGICGVYPHSLGAPEGNYQDTSFVSVDRI
jgi:Fe-S oxidoreductase